MRKFELIKEILNAWTSCALLFIAKHSFPQFWFELFQLLTGQLLLTWVVTWIQASIAVSDVTSTAP